MTVKPSPDRQPPSSIDAEESVLGSMLVSSTAAVYALGVLQPTHFYRQSHQTMFAAMLHLSENGTAIDELTLFERLKDIKMLDDIGGPSAIAKLSNGVPTATNIAHYASRVMDLFMRREVLYLARKIQDEVFDGELTGQELLQSADSKLLDLQQANDGQSGDLVEQRVSVHELIGDMERRAQTRGQLTGVDTGLTRLNEFTGGWQRGNLVVIGARPSVGKTSLGLTMALAAARSGTSVCYFSIEMSRQEIEYRMLSQITGIALYRLLNAYAVSAHESTRISRALEEMSTLPLAIDDSESLTPAQLRGRCRKWVISKQVGAIFVDYIQLMSASSDRQDATNRATEIAYVSRRLKRLARELNVPAIVMSQLNRASEGREDRRPRMADLRESGAIEQDADVVILIHRADHKVSGDAEIIVEKGRNVPTGVFSATFETETATFTNHVPQEESPTPTVSESPESASLSRTQAGRARRHVRT